MKSFKSAYQEEFSSVVPDGTLLSETKRRMRGAQNRCRQGRRIGYAAVAACLILAFSGAAVLLKDRGAVNPQGPQQSPNGITAQIRTPEEVSRPESLDEPSESVKSEDSQGALPIQSDVEGVKEGEWRAIAQSELYSEALYASYIPTSFLPGYAFESASVSKNHDLEAFILSYTDGGYDYIRITIRPYIESDASRMTAAAAIEQYNICEYSIPLADSVPHELYETMHYPIFQAREISEDVLRLRILAVSEQGEDQTQKESMSFSLLCGDMVVEYSIKGAKLEPGAVLDMIQSASFYRS